MRRIFLIAIILCSFFSCGKRELVIGHIEGLKNDTLLVSIRSMNNLNGVPRIDTVVAQSGEFSILRDRDSIYDAVISIYPLQADMELAGQKYRPESMIMTVLSPANKRIELHGNVKPGMWIEYFAQGGGNSELSKAYNVINPQQAKIVALDQQISRFYTRNITKEAIDSLYKLQNIIIAEISSIKKDIIRKKRNEIVAGYLITQTPYEFAYDNFETLTEQVRNSMLKPMLDVYINSVKTHTKTLLNAQNLVPGMNAPDFELPRADSTNFILSSLRGRYCVLVFWSSWSKWCTQEFQPMTDYYLQHWRYVEFVGVNCFDNQVSWLDSIKENESPWINVRDIDNDVDRNVTALYGVENLPTKIIINPEGKIIDKIVGNDELFFRKLTYAIHNRL